MGKKTKHGAPATAMTEALAGEWAFIAAEDIDQPCDVLRHNPSGAAFYMRRSGDVGPVCVMAPENKHTRRWNWTKLEKRALKEYTRLCELIRVPVHCRHCGKGGSVQVRRFCTAAELFQYCCYECAERIRNDQPAF